MRLIKIISLLTLLLNSAVVGAEQKVKLQTNYGDIVIQLYGEKSPITVKNFLRYVRGGLYNGTVFHRVVPGFVVQGGGFDKTYKAIETFEPIKNEAINGLNNLAATVAMARHTNKDSADSQFFINLKHNENLDRRNDTNRGYGYAVFGKVIEGMKVVEEISNIPTGSIEHIGDEVPAYPVILQKAEIVND